MMANRIGRRQFLAVSGAAAASASSLAAAKPGPAVTPPHAVMAEALKYRKVDSHNHVGAGGITVKDIIESADRVGIERMAVSIPRGEKPEEFRAANNKILDAVKQHPDRFIGQCFVNPHYPREAMEELNRCLGEGFIGLGELYTQAKINDPVFFPLIERSIEANAPVMMHARADTGLLRSGFPTEAPPATSVADDFVDVAKRYPDLMLIHAHIGGGGDWEYMCKVLRAHPSIYIDTGGSITDQGMIDFAKTTLGVERMLFSTDCNFETGVGKILAADLNEDERNRVFWSNYNDILRKRGLDAN